MKIVYCNMNFLNSRLIRCGTPVPKCNADLEGLLGQSVAIAVVEDPGAASSCSPMHAKEFQTLSESTLDTNFIEASLIDEVVEFVDVPTDVHPIVEVSCGTSCCPLCFDVFLECFCEVVVQTEVFFGLCNTYLKSVSKTTMEVLQLTFTLLSLSWTIFQI